MVEITEVEAPAGKPPAIKPKSGYIKTLDGWRTIAVWAVIFYHSPIVAIGPIGLHGLHDFCEKGVQLFFAISGILICSRLLEEQRQHGSISLKNFYIRRIFRIQPAAIAFLMVVGSLGLAGLLHISLSPSMASLFCYRNFYTAANGASLPDDAYTAHFWSLAVEEHFYLVLPALIVFARNRIAVLLGAMSVVFFLWPQLVAHLHLWNSPNLFWRTDMSLRALLIPAFLAVLLARPGFRTWFTYVSRRGMLIFLPLALIFVSLFFAHSHFINEICCLGFPLMIASTAVHPENWLGRLLETRPFTFMGRISYSLYLWQQLVFRNGGYHGWLNHLQVGPWNVFALLGCAIASYYIVEKPLMRIGHKLAPPATPGRGDLSA